MYINAEAALKDLGKREKSRQILKPFYFGSSEQVFRYMIVFNKPNDQTKTPFFGRKTKM